MSEDVNKLLSNYNAECDLAHERAKSGFRGSPDYYWVLNVYNTRTLVFYDRIYDDELERDVLSGITTVVTVTPEGDTVVGFSYCNIDKESVNRKLGRQIAAGRALKMMYANESHIYEGSCTAPEEKDYDFIMNHNFYTKVGESILRYVGGRCTGIYVPYSDLENAFKEGGVFSLVLDDKELKLMEKLFSVEQAENKITITV